MKITVMFHDNRPFVNTRVFKNFEYDGVRIDLLLNGLGGTGMDVYIYPYGTTIEDYKDQDPIASQVRRPQGYLVINTLKWRRYYESNH